MQSRLEPTHDPAVLRARATSRIQDLAQEHDWLEYKAPGEECPACGAEEGRYRYLREPKEGFPVGDIRYPTPWYCVSCKFQWGYVPKDSPE